MNLLNKGLAIHRSERLVAYAESYPSLAEQLDRSLSSAIPAVEPSRSSLRVQLREIEGFLSELLVHQLHSIDLPARPDRLDPRHQRWFQETLRRLREQGLPVTQGEP